MIRYVLNNQAELAEILAAKKPRKSLFARSKKEAVEEVEPGAQKTFSSPIAIAKLRFKWKLYSLFAFLLSLDLLDIFVVLILWMFIEDGNSFQVLMQVSMIVLYFPVRMLALFALLDYFREEVLNSPVDERSESVVASRKTDPSSSNNKLTDGGASFSALHTSMQSSVVQSNIASHLAHESVMKSSNIEKSESV
jgi:hypothetical protein